MPIDANLFNWLADDPFPMPAAAADPPAPDALPWGGEETKYLVDQAVATFALMDTDPSINVPHDLVWTEVARKMAARGFNRSKEDCKKRFKSVLHYYKYNYRQISTGKQYYCGSPLERHLNRLEAKAASGSSSAAESSFAGAGKARARPKAKAGERKKRRRSVGLAAPAGQSGAGVAPAGQSGAGAAAAPDALLALVCREMDWREQRILERVQNMLVTAGVLPSSFGGVFPPPTTSSSSSSSSIRRVPAATPSRDGRPSPAVASILSVKVVAYASP